MSADVLSDGGPNLTTNGAVAVCRQARDLGGEIDRDPPGKRYLHPSLCVCIRAQREVYTCSRADLLPIFRIVQKALGALLSDYALA